MSPLSAPIFRFDDGQALNTDEPHILRPADRPATDGMLAMTGPSNCADRSRLPVRGDLAHIKLAGRCFVPHYAVPMPHLARAGAVLLAAEAPDAEVLQPIAAGERFDVLDIAGAWAWGQLAGPPHGEDGPVGYVELAQLEPVAPPAPGIGTA